MVSLPGVSVAIVHGNLAARAKPEWYRCRVSPVVCCYDNFPNWTLRVRKSCHSETSPSFRRQSDLSAVAEK
jgi:hypothetical protein